MKQVNISAIEIKAINLAKCATAGSTKPNEIHLYFEIEEDANLRMFRFKTKEETEKFIEVLTNFKDAVFGRILLSGVH